MFPLPSVFITFVAIFCIRTISSTRTPYERLKVMPISAFADLERFYLQVRRRNEGSHTTEPETIEDPRVKSRICESVLTSAAMRQMRPRMKPARVNSRLSIDYWTLKRSNDVMSKVLRDEAGGKWKGSFQFPNRTRTIRLDRPGGDLEANAFICVGKEAGEYSDYYISEEYNANLVTNDGEPYVAARFIFVLAFADKMKVYSVAIEPASVVESVQARVETAYTEARRSRTALTANGELLGQLQPHQRLQVCWSVLNSAYFDGAVVLTTGAETSYTLEDVLIRQFVSIQKEWMIDCRTRIRKKGGKDLWYYISRGTSPNSYFVYSVGNRVAGAELFVLANLSTNIAQYLFAVSEMRY